MSISNWEITLVSPLRQRQVIDTKATKQTDLHSPQSNNDVLLALQEIEPKPNKSGLGSKQPEIAVRADQSIFTRALEPHKPEHV